MAGFDSISKDKSRILATLISDQELCKAVYYNEPNFLDQPDIPQTSNLIYRNIYPHYFVPDQEEEIARTYITLSFKNVRKVKGFYKAGQILIYAFTHKELFKTNYGLLRVDYIVDKIDSLFNGITGISIGKLEFYGMDEIIVSKNYYGSHLVYNTYNFN